MDQETMETHQLPESVRKQAQEADNIIQGLNTATSPEGGPEETTGGQEEPAEEPSQHPKEGAGEGEQEPEGESQPEPSGEEDYKAKYLTLKGKYDAEVPRLHQENKGLKQQLQTLQNQVQQLQQQGQQGGQQAGQEEPTGDEDFDPEDLAEYGTEFKKLAQKVQQLSQDNARLRKKAGEIEQTVGSVQEHQQQSAEQRFWSDLDDAVPQWREINEDPAFQQWLQEADPFSGKTRNDALQEAQQGLDGNRAAQILNYFVNQTEAGAKFRKGTAQQEPQQQQQDQGKKPQRPAKNVQPERSRGSDPNAQGNKSYWTKQDINDFYAKQRRGDFNGREEERRKLEEDLFQAMQEGRVET